MTSGIGTMYESLRNARKRVLMFNCLLPVQRIVGTNIKENLEKLYLQLLFILLDLIIRREGCCNDIRYTQDVCILGNARKSMLLLNCLLPVQRIMGADIKEHFECYISYIENAIQPTQSYQKTEGLLYNDIRNTCLHL